MEAKINQGYCCVTSLVDSNNYPAKGFTYGKNNIGLKDRKLAFQLQLCHQNNCVTWTKSQSSLKLNFLICKKQMSQSPE